MVLSVAAEQAPAASTFFDLVSPLEAIPRAERRHACARLIDSIAQLANVRAYLAGRPPPEIEGLQDLNRLLAAWLAAYYAGASATPSILNADMLDAEVMATGAIAPFVGPGPDGGAKFGVPTNVTDETLCDNASELLRMAAAALVSLFVYLNFTQAEDNLPPDEVTLIFTTIAIQSCSVASVAAAIDGQLAALFGAEAEEAEAGSSDGTAAAATAVAGLSLGEGAAAGSSSSSGAPDPHLATQPVPPDAAAGGSGQGAGEGGGAGAASSRELLFRPPPRLRCRQIKWLMHWVRSVAMQQMGGVAYLTGLKERQADCLQCVQRDQQHMIKAVPTNPLGYTLYARSCMNFQQMTGAAAFLTRGLQVAQQVGDDKCEAAMSFQLAVALLLGAKGEEVPADEVLGLMAGGEAARESLLGWWPPSWAAAAMDGEPDRTLLTGRLLPELAKRGAGELAPGAAVKALGGLLYVTKPPTSIAPGALVAR